MLHLIGSLLIFLAAVIGTASAALHLAWVPWRDTEMSRHLAFYMTSLALVLDLSCIRIVFGDPTWFQVVRLVVFVAVPLSMAWRLRLQVQAHRLDRPIVRRRGGRRGP